MRASSLSRALPGSRSPRPHCWRTPWRFFRARRGHGFSCLRRYGDRERSSRDDKAFRELLEVVTNPVARLKLDWPQEQENPRHSKLDDRFLSGGQGERSQHRSLPFFLDLHDELSRSWSKPYSSCIFVPTMSIYSTIVGAKVQRYVTMPQVETLAGYLSPGSLSSLKKPTLPTKPCRLTSSLVGKPPGKC